LTKQLTPAKSIGILTGSQRDLIKLAETTAVVLIARAIANIQQKSGK
jgi:hypothetical protein